MRISVLGCGRWGSFHLWYAARRGFHVTGWEPAESLPFRDLMKERSNAYLELPGEVRLTTDLGEALGADQIIAAVPAQLFRTLARELSRHDLERTDLVLCMKGLELDTGKRLSTVALEEGIRCRSVSVWVGPGHPQDFVAGVPGCMLVVSEKEEAAKRITGRMGSPLVRIYHSTDLIGCEIGAAAKNVIGIAAGMLDGMKMSGLKGALMARGPQEVARLVKAAGGDWRSVYGLSHLGDYEATLFSRFSRNRGFGEALVMGETLQGLAEGVPTSKAMLSLAEELSVELPVTSMVRRIIDGELDLKTAIGRLFLRPQKEEFSAELPSFLVLLAMFSISPAENAEYRYFWVVRNGLSTPGEIDELLNRAAEAGANGVLVQVVGRGEAYYSSDVLPPAEFSGFDDPLEYLIMKARPLGLEVHAWVNAFLVWSSPIAPPSPEHIYNTHPEWFTGHANGRSSRAFSPEAAEAAGLVGATLSPAYPGVRNYIADIAREIAMNYDVAGIHLDYIRYPNSSFGYSPGEVELYFLETCLQPEDDPLSWENWKRQQVTATVETVRAVLRGSDPQMILTCAVMADPNTAREEFSCDWRYWLSQGLVDLAFPMAYTSNRERALELASSITLEHPEKIVYGIGMWNQSAENALPAAERALSLGARGICVFSLNSLSPGDGEVLRSRWGTGPMPDHGVSPAMFNRVVIP